MSTAGAFHLQPLDKKLRGKLEGTVKEARDVAEEAARAACNQLGVGRAKPDAHQTEAEKDLRRRLRIHGRQLGDIRDQKTETQELDRLVDEIAYEHWHRMLFARFLAENQLLMYPDPDEPVAVSLEDCEDLAADEGANSGWELAARFATKMLPQIFRVDSPVFALTLPPEKQQKLEQLLAGLLPEVFTASDSLGWVYQFWQVRRKEQVNASEVKIGARELPAVTQLFTEDYMVDFLLDNTLGAWHAGKILRSQNKLAESAINEEQLRDSLALPGCPWHYLRFVRTKNGNWAPAAGTFEGWPKTAKELKCLDPCMGSGHFIVAMLERLVPLRMAEEQLDKLTAVTDVIRTNLFGLEVDPRCTQLAAFNLALAAWRHVGHCILPPMNLACSGLAPNATKEDWISLAEGDEKLQGGMERLHDLFSQAPLLGSLIDPRAEEGDLLVATFHELQPLLDRVLLKEKKDDSAYEMAVAARGASQAAEILASRFSLVATNVPYLGRRKQDDVLMDYCERIYPQAKKDLATCFIERCLAFCRSGCSTSLLVLQNWLFLKTYKSLRVKMLQNAKWDFVCRMGAKAFQTPMYDFGVVMQSFTAAKPSTTSNLIGLDVGASSSAEKKALALRDCDVSTVNQLSQLEKPDSAITFEEASQLPLLAEYADSHQGAHTFDINRFRLCFWEMNSCLDFWNLHSSSPTGLADYSGCHYVSYKRDANNAFGRTIKQTKSVMWRNGHRAWGKNGVACAWMGKLPVSLYIGQVFDNSVAVIVPKNPAHLLSIFCFLSSPTYLLEIRKVNQKTQVADSTLVKVPFDLAYWQTVAAEKYPHGFPKPYSSDPTQWLFDGNPRGSDNPLQVAVARLVGYQWPRQTGSSFTDCPVLGPDGLESCADKDDIVCIPPVRGEASAGDRLLNLLASAYGDEWNGDVLNRLLADAGYAGKSLEVWLREGFFTQHLDTFHNRPFIWHIWDGLKDGFSVLVNYHKLDNKLLESLIYTYLNDWITTQKHQVGKVDGSQERLDAANAVKAKLELILEGESPHDIFVRWKPLAEQPVGWNPDLNDGVRVNIRPWMTVGDVGKKGGTGILRDKPTFDWKKDRGTDVASAPWVHLGPEYGEKVAARINDHHLTLAEKKQARIASKVEVGA